MKTIIFIVAIMAIYLFLVPLVVMYLLQAAHDQDPRIPEFNYWGTWFLVLALNVALDMSTRNKK